MQTSEQVTGSNERGLGVMKKNFQLGMRQRLRSMMLWSMSCILACQCLVLSQNPVGDSLYTVGTTAVDFQGRTWAYVLWQASSDGLVIGKKFSVNSKPGLPADPLDYERQGIAVVQTDPQSIGILLQRGELLGDDLAHLADRIDQLFVGVVPVGDISLAEKLSIVIRGSLGDLNRFQNLVMLGRLHPSVNLCIGYAFAVRIPDVGPTTFEIRDYDLTHDRDIGVVGRVSLDPSVPVILPAPGKPVEVPEYPAGSAKGDLNVKLRWATSPPLRRLALLNYGFNVFRMAKAFAEDQGYHLSPPTATTMTQLVQTQEAVHQVNNLPILKSKDFTILDVADFVADTETVFVADDNERYKDGGVAFENGSQYYYFVAGRDVLGRMGAVSDALLVTICDRLPPDSPRRLQVVNDYSFDGVGNKQVLKVSWEQHGNPDQDTVVAYYVYRWSSPSEVQVNGSDPLVNQIAGPIAPAPGKRLSYVDDGVGSPQSPADYGKTYWYTVRTVDDGACDGGNYSAHSAPAFGVLRDRAGPAGPTGGVFVICCEPEAKGLDAVDVEDPNGKEQRDDLAYYQLACRRLDQRIQWAEFYAFNTTSPDNFLGRIAYLPGKSTVDMMWTASREKLVGDIPFYCRVGSKDGKVSGFALVQTLRAPKFSTLRRVLFEGFTDCRRVPFFRDPQTIDPNTDIAGTTPGIRGKFPCRGHYPNPPDAIGSPNDQGIEVVVQLTPGTREFKLYRRVDFGPLTLIAQGEADYDDVMQISYEDSNMPSNSGVVCYYGQLFDENGNTSPLTLLSDCVPVIQPTAIPMLLPLESVGTENDPQMRIRWFCPPYGIERFEVSVANHLEMVANEISDALSTQTVASPQTKTYSIDGEDLEQSFALFHTPLVGPGFGNGAIFEVTVNIALGQEYVVMVGAVDKAGEVNPDSNAETFTWEASDPGVGPDVPWPARPLPSLNLFHPRMAAVRLHDSVYSGVGISIGEFTAKQWIQRDDKGTPTIDSRDQEGNGTASGADTQNDNTLDLVRLVPNLDLAANVDSSRGRFGEVNEVFDHVSGILLPSASQELAESFSLRPKIVPYTLLYQNTEGEIIFPVVLYRTQVPNELYPTVSGDVIQVSPLMEEIAFDWVVDPVFGDVTEVRDPFLVATPPINFGNEILPGFIFLKDTQPVVEGARYLYLLVRFGDDGEIKEIVPTNAVTITP